MNIFRQFFSQVKRITVTRICYACREPFEGKGTRFAKRIYCSETCIPKVLRDTYADLLDQRARDGGAV